MGKQTRLAQENVIWVCPGILLPDPGIIISNDKAQMSKSKIQKTCSTFTGVWSFDHLDLIWHLNLVIWHSYTESKLFQAKSNTSDHKQKT
jgi:hypothetical protein